MEAGSGSPPVPCESGLTTEALLCVRTHRTARAQGRVPGGGDQAAVKRMLVLISTV